MDMEGPYLRILGAKFGGSSADVFGGGNIAITALLSFFNGQTL
jgi:hypothetical protein